MEPFTGQISVFGFSFPPVNWAMCQGQIVPIQQNTALFSLIGTTYGGNGTTNFQLPNLQGQVAVGQGQADSGTPYVMGETGGTSTVTLNTTDMPIHSHNLMGTLQIADTNDPTGAVLARPQVSGTPKNIVGNLYNSNAIDTPVSATIAPSVSQNLPHDNLQPYLALNYCICLRGIFPQRG